MDQGRVAESGKHAELIAARGVYAKLHALGFGSDANQIGV
jgi:ABC-type multidrug transport system fused ATPase/permease subunit